MEPRTARVLGRVSDGLFVHVSAKIRITADIHAAVSRPDRQYGTTSLPNDATGRRTEEHMAHRSVAVGAEHDEIRLPLASDAHDAALRRSRDETLDLHVRRRGRDNGIEARRDIRFEIAEAGRVNVNGRRFRGVRTSRPSKSASAELTGGSACPPPPGDGQLQVMGRQSARRGGNRLSKSCWTSTANAGRQRRSSEVSACRDRGTTGITRAAAEYSPFAIATRRHHRGG